MKASPVVTLSFFRFSGWVDRWWAFKQMGLPHPALREIPGLGFCKLLGSGGGNGFSIRPDWGAYGFLAVWERKALAKSFLGGHPFIQGYRERSQEHYTVYLETIAAHGRWDGGEPFTPVAGPEADRPLAVLTRATIRPRQLWKFWRYTPPASRSLAGREGLLFAKGIGEWPLIQQATFSLWENQAAMQAFAYGNHHHQKVIRKTRELGWYKEELFARFHPVASEGSWGGRDPLEATR